MNALLDHPSMAKKKSPDTSWVGKGKKPVVIQVRGSEEYREWLEALCRYDHRKASDIVEHALAKHARDIGFREPPER